jgi:hypothetical protein
MSATIKSKSASQIITSGQPPTPTFDLFIHSFPPQAAKKNEVREWLLTWYTGSSNDELIVVGEVLNRIHLTGMQLRELSQNALVWHLEGASMDAKWAKRLSKDIEWAKEVEIDKLEVC